MGWIEGGASCYMGQRRFGLTARELKDSRHQHQQRQGCRLWNQLQVQEEAKVPRQEKAYRRQGREGKAPQACFCGQLLFGGSWLLASLVPVAAA